MRAARLVIHNPDEDKSSVGGTQAWLRLAVPLANLFRHEVRSSPSTGGGTCPGPKRPFCSATANVYLRTVLRVSMSLVGCMGPSRVATGDGQPQLSATVGLATCRGGQGRPGDRDGRRGVCHLTSRDKTKQNVCPAASAIGV